MKNGLRLLQEHPRESVWLQPGCLPRRSIMSSVWREQRRNSSRKILSWSIWAIRQRHKMQQQIFCSALAAFIIW